MTPMTTNVGATPCGDTDLKEAMSAVDSGEAIIAPPPKPMIAIPVAIPGRSGNHLMSVETGEMYPSPSPMPPRTPYPSSSNQNWCVAPPSAATSNPPPKQSADANIARRGPTRSSHAPKTAAETPRKTIARLNTQPIVLSLQSSGADAFPPINCDSGKLKTLNAYAWPIERWIARAAGGTSQRE